MAKPPARVKLQTPPAEPCTGDRPADAKIVADRVIDQAKELDTWTSDTTTNIADIYHLLANIAGSLDAAKDSLLASEKALISQSILSCERYIKERRAIIPKNKSKYFDAIAEKMSILTALLELDEILPDAPAPLVSVGGEEEGILVDPLVVKLTEALRVAETNAPVLASEIAKVLAMAKGEVAARQDAPAPELPVAPFDRPKQDALIANEADNEVREFAKSLIANGVVLIDKRDELISNLKSAVFKAQTGIYIAFPSAFSLAQAYAVINVSDKHKWSTRPSRRGGVDKYISDVFGAIASISPIPLSLIREVDFDLYRRLQGGTADERFFPDGILHDTFEFNHSRPRLKPFLRTVKPKPR